MTVTQFQILVYGLLAVATAALIVRYVRKRRRNVGQVDKQKRQTSEARPVAGGNQTRTSPKSGMPRPSLVSRSARPDSTWTDRTLFTPLNPRHGRASSGVQTSGLGTDSTTGRPFGAVTPVLAALLPESEARRREIEAELQRAGYYQPHAAENLAAIRYVAIVAPILAFGSLLLLVPPTWEMRILAMLVTLSLFGWALPRLYVKSRAAERRAEIERSMPDMLDMLNMCVSQGLTVPSSLNRIGRDLGPVHPALAQELRIVSEQAAIGTLEQALDNFGRRIDVPEVHSFTSLITQTERMGTSISDALTEYSDNMRENLRQQADQKANQATFKLLFPTVLCLMPAVFIFLLGPAIVSLSDFFSGGADVLDQSQQAVLEYAPQSFEAR